MSGDRGIMMSRNRSYVVVLVLLTLVAGLSGVLGNVASGTLPVAWQPYLWLAWPLFAILLLATVGLAVWQARLERKITMSGETEQERPTPVLLPVPQIPNNLPPRGEFIGRDAEKARVHEALRSRSYLVSIDGIGGIGKTSLALEVAHECLRASKGADSSGGIARFSGFIWTTAKDRDLTLNALLDAVARTLDYPGIVQQSVEDKRSAVCKLLQEKPHLLIVDNFETITDESVRDFLLELPEPSKTLLTTREQKLRQVRAISLKGLTESEALALIRNEGRRLGLASLEHAEDRVLLHLYQATGGAPLAIKWAVGQIKQQGQSLDTILVALHEARGSVFDNIFARSWSLLSASARQVLIVMPIFATSASREGIEAASDVYHFVLDEALGQLVEMSLVDATDELDLARRRYSIHPLTRAFVEAKLRQEPEIRQTAQQRLTDFIQSFAAKHGGDWHQEGFAQLELEIPNVLATIQWCWGQRLLNPGMDIFRNVSYFMTNRGFWNDLLAFSLQAVELATELGDELTTAPFRVRPIGWIHRHRGDLDLAEEQVSQALAIFEESGQEQGVASAKRSLGRIAQERGDLEQAERLLSEALALYRSFGSEPQIYFVTANLADVKLDQGDLETAWELCNGVLEPARKLNAPDNVAGVLTVAGRVAYQRGDLQQAKAFWEEGLIHAKRAYRLDGIAGNLYRLAHIEAQTGQVQMARRMLSDALDIYRSLDMQSRVREVGDLLARLPKPAEHVEQPEGHQPDEK